MVWVRRLWRLLLYGPLVVIVASMLLLDCTSHPVAAVTPLVAPAGLAERLAAHVRTIASVPHNDGSALAYDAVRAYVKSQLSAVGCDVHVDDYRNVLATHGSGDPVILGAHYDSAYEAPGADDNGSGVAVMIEVARSLCGADGSFAFHGYANEEPPCFQTRCMGSLHAAAEAKAAGLHPKAIWVLDAVGFYSDKPGSQRWPLAIPGLPSTGNFISIVGTPRAASDVFWLRQQLERTSSVPVSAGVVPGVVAGVEWSDHWSWGQAGYSALMITDTAVFRNPNYHEAEDLPDTLDYPKLAALTTALTEALRVRSGE